MAEREKALAGAMMSKEMDNQFRATMRDIHASYYAAENSRYMPGPPGTLPFGTGADYHYRLQTDYFRIVERSRYFDRDNMIIGQGLNRLTANIVQEGFTLDPNTGDTEVDKELQSYFTEWGADPDQCDWEGELTFHDFEQLIFRTILVDGDVLALPLASGQLQHVENHLLRNPWIKAPTSQQNIVHGVEMADKNRRKRTAYWLCTENINPLQPVVASTSFQRYLARDKDGFRNVFHYYFPKRMSQTRGVSAMAPAVVPIQYHDDLEFAMMLKAKAASFIAIFTKLAVDAPTSNDNRIAGNRSLVQQEDGSTRTYEQQGPAAMVKGKAGEELQGFAPNIPNPEFFTHANLILNIVSVNLDLPLAVLLLDPSKTNFSGWRGAIDQARQRFRQIQHWYRRRFHKPIYQWKVRQKLAKDYALLRASRRSGIDVFKHRWHPPRWAYIEPLKDRMAADFGVSRNLTSQRRRAAEEGVEFDELVTEIVEDRAQIAVKAYELAQKLNTKYPKKGDDPGISLNWRELAYGHKSDGIQLQYAETLSDTPNTPETVDTEKTNAK